MYPTLKLRLILFDYIQVDYKLYRMGKTKLSTEDKKYVFVFYELNAKHPSPIWHYPDSLFPQGWGWVGKGGTGVQKYSSDEQFSGPTKSRTLMRKRLDAFMKIQKDSGKIVRYKIRNSYNP